MSGNNKNYVRVKALSFINKVSDYLTKSLARDSADSDNLSMSSSAEIPGPNTDTYLSDDNSAKEDDKFQESMRLSIIKKLWPETEQALSANPDKSTLSGESSPKRKIADTANAPVGSRELNNLYNEKQNQNLVKMKADTFKGKITGHGNRKTSEKKVEEKAPDNLIKEHRIFINSKKARELGLYQKFYAEKTIQQPVEKPVRKVPGKVAAPPPPPPVIPVKPVAPVIKEEIKIPEPELQKPVKPATVVQKQSSPPVVVVLKTDEPEPVIEAPTPPPPEPERQEKSNNLRIFEEGVFLGLKVGESTRSQAIETLKPHSNIRFDIGSKDSVLDYHDISFLIHFDERGVISEFEFNKNFPGTTSKGLKVGDSIDRAIKIYGMPVIQLEKEACWPNMKIIYNRFYIISIMISKPNQYIESEKKALVRNFKVYTEGMLIGVIVGESTKSIIVGGHNRAHVFQFMKDYSSSNDIYTTGSNLNYKDIDVIIYFDDTDIVTSIGFGGNFIGATVKGLKIGDSLETAIKLYGEPDLRNDELVSWNKFKVYVINNKITSFKVHR
jgi:hypothetical protein